MVGVKLGLLVALLAAHTRLVIDDKGYYDSQERGGDALSGLLCMLDR